jgi:hypothetical protein
MDPSGLPAVGVIHFADGIHVGGVQGLESPARDLDVLCDIAYSDSPAASRASGQPA